VLVSPLHERREREPQVAALRREPVLEALRALLIADALEDAVLDELRQAIGEDVSRDTEAFVELLEPPPPEERVAHDEERPALADELESAGDRAFLTFVVALQHVFRVASCVKQLNRATVSFVMQRKWLVLAVTSVAVFMSFLDATIVNIAFPSIRASFPDASLGDLSWVINAYSIVFASLLVPAGRLADRIGRKRVFLGGVVLFLIGSAACGLAPTVGVLVAARVLQAVGAAALVPTSLGLLLPEFPLDQRATATALWGATGGVAAATGPALGGILIHFFDWRAVFFVNLFIGIPALIPARRLLRDLREEKASPPPSPLGIVLLVGAIGALSLGIVNGGSWGWGSPRIVGAFALAAALTVAFVAHSARSTRPLVELTLFRVRSFTVATVGAFIFALSFFALLLSNALFLTGVWHYSIIRAGFALMPGPLMATAFSPVAGMLSDRFGQRLVAVPGGILFALGTALLAARVGAEPHYATAFLPGTLLTGAGVGLTFGGFASAAVAELPRDRFSTGSGVFSMVRQLGAVIGIAVLVAILGAEGSDVATFQHVWTLMIGGGVGSALAGLALGRVRARHVMPSPRELAVDPFEALAD
jgi:EmrB/QacA subfamily drug resistance transporter